MCTEEGGSWRVPDKITHKDMTPCEHTQIHDCAHTIVFLLSPFMSLHCISLSEDDILGKGIQQSSPDILVHLKKNFHQCEVTMRTQKRGIKTILFIYLCIII